MKSKGFSLLEVLAAIVIAGILFASVMASYLSLYRANQKSDISRQLQRELNFAMTRMADQVRAFSIDYKSYEDAGIDPKSSEILFTNGRGSGQVHTFERENFSLNGRTYSRLIMDGTRLFSEKFNVKDIYFYITPTHNPFDPGNIGNRQIQLQPKATIFLNIESIADPSINFQIQTTVSSRKYENE